MAFNAKKSGKQCTLDAWRQKLPQQQTEMMHVATTCSQKQQADDALKQLFGHNAYKSDVQQKAVSAVLTGFLLTVLSVESWLNEDIIYNFRSEIHGTGIRSEITVKSVMPKNRPGPARPGHINFIIRG